MAIHRRYNVMRWHTNYHGFGFQADMIVRLLDEGFHYKEVNVVTHERKKGASSALTLRNFFSVTHTFMDLMVPPHGQEPILPQTSDACQGGLAPQIGPVPFMGRPRLRAICGPSLTLPARTRAACGLALVAHLDSRTPSRQRPYQ